MWALILGLSAAAAVYSWRSVRRGAAFLAYADQALQRWDELCLAGQAPDPAKFDIVELMEREARWRRHTWVATVSLGINGGLVLSALWGLYQGW